MALEVEDLEWMVLQLGWLDHLKEDREDGYSYDADLVLPSRSALELIRDRLTPEQAAALDAFDEKARTAPEDFNRWFALEHHRITDRRAACEGYIWDDDGTTPEIPASHWWWRPLETDKPRR